ncbi:MAG TPA: hypothetical protein VN648_15675, partial [Candidatus Methylomirabilis sp.]|nr:hypothetical protein [Candidatus Methylomirabilis sp.]
MTRNEFMKCTVGACCSALAFLPEAAEAQSGDPELNALRGRVEATQRRFAKLIGVLHENLDEPTRKKILEGLGREC